MATVLNPAVQTERERAILADIEGRQEELIALASDLIRFDTTARLGNEPARQEAELQRYLAGRLDAAGAEIDLWEPDPIPLAGNPLVPPELRFDGRPQLAARFPRAGSGPSLLLNGHIDVVSAEPLDEWTSGPFDPRVHGGKLYGRGAADMKGGIAAMVFAAETLTRLGICLAGDLLVCTNTDEESTGAGAVAAVARGVRADAAIVTEATDFDVWTACRGSLIPTITVEGRSGHAGYPQPHWSAGGAVNAIEKAGVVLAAMQRLQEEWRTRPDHRHPLLSPGDIVPVTIEGGDWVVSFPARCRITYHIAYLPTLAGPDGWSPAIEREIEETLARAAAADPWLAEHPPAVTWGPPVYAAEISPAEPIVGTMLAAAADSGRPGRVAGMDNWHDGTTFIHLAHTPTICFGPGAHAQAHAVDEFVPVADLIHAAQAIALAALRFCGDAAAER